MKTLWIILAILAGICNPFQSGSNSELYRITGAPMVTALFVYGVGLLCLLAIAPFFGFPIREFAEKLPNAPWYALIGGFCNVFFLLVGLTVAKQLGSATFTLTVVIAAATTSMLLDNFGLLGFAARTLTLGRAIGAVLAVLGVMCIAIF